MTGFEYESLYLQAGLKGLEDYLLSDQLFYTLRLAAPPGQPAYPALTLGGVLLFGARASARANQPQRQAILQKITFQLDAQRQRWRVAWERKAAWEFGSRLNQWSQYLNEVRREPEKAAAYYAYEVRLRLMLALLRPEFHQLDPQQSQLLDETDAWLRFLFQKSDFIWENELIPAFPEDKFWYLWGRLKE